MAATPVATRVAAPPATGGTVLALDESSAVSVPVPALRGEALVETQTQLRDAETSNPVAGADAAMWGSTARSATAGDTANLEATVSHRRGTAAARNPDASPLHRLANRILRRTSTIAVSLTKNAMQFIGTPYVFGGTSPSGFDCSGYTQHVFAAIGIHLPRTADAQYYAGATIRGDLVAGDLVFFQTYEPGPSHVGIYLGNGHFIHSSSHGVGVSALSERYWANRYLGAKRFMREAATL